MTNQLQAVVKGDYERISFVIYNPDRTVRNITGETVHFYAKRTSADTTALIHKDNAATGGVTVSSANPSVGTPQTPHGFAVVNPADLSAIMADTVLVCAIKHVDSSGNPSTTEFELPVRVAAGS